MKAGLQQTLCAWFARDRRDLPWRRTRDPYAIWISEAMLQQTRVEAVLDHYRRFLAKFPTLRALAAADEEDVVAAWSGLGYYRRARALHAAARTIIAEHGGEFPRTRAGMLSLPGVGPYTAGAVLSIAFDLPEPLVDGNVTRVLSRLFAIDAEGSALQRRVWALASELVAELESGQAPGDWNQALMELGALVCTPRTPACSICPVREPCQGRRQRLVEELPRKVRKRDPIDVALEVLLVEDERGVLLLRRPAAGRMASMWELPTREIAQERGHLWPIDHALQVPKLGAELGTVPHSITHHRIRATVRQASVVSRESSPAVESRRARAEELSDLALTGLTRKILSRYC